MAIDPKVRLPWDTFAAERRTLAGRIDAATLAPRLAEALARERPAGTVAYELHFAPVPAAAGEAVIVTGQLRARLEATCQRCLEPFEMTLEVAVDVEVETSRAAPESKAGSDRSVPDRADADAVPSLDALIEEELILAIPFLPRHPGDFCPQAPGAREAEPEDSDMQRPFAGLQEAMERARKGRGE